MKHFLLGLFKIVLVLLLIGAVGAITYYFALKQGQPAWLAFLAMALTAAILLLAITLRRYLQRRRERQFVKRVIDQDQAAIDAAPAQAEKRLKRLLQRWNKAIELIRTSSLKQRGDPLYALPWFLLFGESGSGKSAMARNARLTAILSEAGAGGDREPTANCDWWFFDQAIVLDTAGKYAAPLSSPQEREEWELFCSLLTKYRRNESLNGLVLTISAERLTTATPDWLAQYGLNLRTRVDEMMRCLGAKFPIYVMVTKSDLIFGLQELAQSLPAASRQLAFGHVFGESAEEPETLVDQAIARISERLKTLRLNRLNPDNPQGNVGLLLFPNELERLAPALVAFVQACFQDNPYQETPLFYGLFFSSSAQQGAPGCGFLRDLESPLPPPVELPGTDQGYFLREFFSRVLPRGRFAAADVPDYLGWRLGIRYLGLAAWFMAVFAIVLMASISYMSNRNAIAEIQAQPRQTRDISGTMEEKVTDLYLFRTSILTLHERNRHWYVPRMGLNASIAVEDRLKAQYLKLMGENVMKPLYQGFNETFWQRQPGALTETQLAHLIEHLVWRLGLLNARIRHGSGADYSAIPGISGQAMHQANPDFPPYLAPYFNLMSQSYLNWTDNEQWLASYQLETRSWLGNLIVRNNAPIHWLTAWANQSPGYRAVTLEDFWSGTGALADPPEVEAAMTAAGKRHIEDFLADIQQALPDNSDLATKIDAFWKWYAPEFQQAWYRFARRFPEGEQRIVSPDDFMARAATMPTIDNPYFQLFARLDTELTAVAGNQTDRLPWIAAARNIDLLLRLWNEETIAAKKSAGTKGLLGKLQGQFTLASEGGIQDRAAALQQLGIGKTEEGTKTIASYIKALQDLVSSIQSPAEALDFIQLAVNPLESKTSSPLAQAGQSLAKLIVIVALDPDDPVAKILAGPRDFLLTAAMREAACELQSRWESNIVATTSRLPQSKLRSTLFGQNQDGLIAKFLDSNAKGLVVNTGAGWQAAKVNQIGFPFTSDFLEFMSNGTVSAQQIQDSYKVTVKSFPINVTHGSKAVPLMAELTLDCLDGTQKLSNFNYPETTEFIWKPEVCGDVRLVIEFPDFQLYREYPGPNGFRDFIQEFKTGEKTFTAQNFKAPLSDIGIQDIVIRFAFEGADEILQLVDLKPIKTPDTMTDCWYR